MADITTTEQTLVIDNYFVDGDTRTITLKNPKNTSLTSQLEALNLFMQNKNILIGDKDGATFGRIKNATKVTKTKKYVDISQ